MPDYPAATSDLTKLSPKVGTTLKLDFEGPVLHAATKLIGYLANRSILVSTPSKNGKPLLFKPGRIVMVRFMINQRIAGFKSSVLEEHLHPYPYLHLEYPDEVEFIQIRNAPRVDVQIIVSVYPENGLDNEKSGILTDLSRSGSKLLMRDDLFKPGDPLRISFKLKIDNQEKIMQIEALARSRGTSGESSVAYGIEFVDLEDQQRVLLDAYVNRQLLKQKN